MKRNTLVTISCGMGNQLFQYAFGYAMSRRRGSKLGFYRIDGGEHRPYVLDLYGIHPNFLIEDKSKTILNRLYLKTFISVNENNPFEFEERLYHDLKGLNVHYNGYWQSWKYFDEYYDEIAKSLQYIGGKGDTYNRYVSLLTDNSVALHVRRGDYLCQEKNLTLSKEYYTCAIQKMRNVVQSPQYLVFSDDKKFAKKEFSFLEEVVFVEGLPDVLEFELMRSCANHIISNSTFSWWAAYLGRNKGGVVYAPRVHNWQDDFYLPRWNLLDAELNK